MEAVKQNAKALQYASRNYVLAAVTNDGLALQYVSRNFVLAAVKKDGLALQYASGAHRSDRVIVEAAVKQNPRLCNTLPAASSWLR